MALIKCSYCDKEISDRATACPQCGNPIVRETEIVEEAKTVCCAECGLELDECVDVCPNCGCPIKEDTIEEIPQKVEVTAVNLPKMNQKTKKRIIVSIIFIVIALLVGGLVRQNMLKKEAERIRLEYAQNLETASYTMLTGAVKAESAGNLIKKVWYNAIYEEYDSETNKYTRPNGYYVDDFNTALSNLFADTEFNELIESIESNQESVAKTMKDLKNPPDEYQDAYDVIKEFYDAYTALTNLATNPSGSLTTFSQNFNEADSETVNCYEAMKLYLED